MTLTILNPRDEDIRVGGYGRNRGQGRPNYRGPNLESQWSSDRNRYYQELNDENLVDLEYRKNDGISVKVYRVRHSDTALVENSLNLVPSSHLAWLNQHKPDGIIAANTAGRGGSARYTGGLNAGYDDRNTPSFDERRGIIITYGAFFRNRNLGICPTILHEIGHVMTRRGKINYGRFSEERRNSLSGMRVSRNPGAMEALCNAYMYFLCYASSDIAIRAYGNGSDEQRDRVTRDGLRACSAFRAMLTEQDRTQFVER